MSAIALCLGAVSCDKENQKGTEDKQSPLEKVWLVKIDNSYTEEGSKVEDVTEFIFDLSRKGRIQIGIRTSGHIKDGLEENQFLTMLEETSCSIDESASKITVTLDDNSTFPIAYKSLNAEGVEFSCVEIFDTEEYYPAGVYTKKIDWVEVLDVDEPISGPGGYVWTCDLGDEGVYCFDFSDFDSSGMNTSGGNADGDYGSFKIGALDGGVGQVEMSGRITYYSEYERNIDTTCDGETMSWQWDVNDAGLDLTLLDENYEPTDVVYACTKYSDGEIVWN